MVDIAISCASSFVSKVAEYLVPPMGRQIGYIWNYNSNFDNLKKEIEQLEDKRDMVQHSVLAARREGEEIEQFVSVWLDNVTKMIVEASTVVGETEQGNTKCFKGLCPNPKKRYQYGKKAAKKVKAVAELRGQGNFTKVSYETSPKEIWIPSHKGYEAFKSRESTLKEIQNALVDPNINMIGVHGSGGIGKTTLVRKVAEHAENNNLFNVVAFTEVKEKPDIEKIQQGIADRLGLKLDKEKSLSERARRLQARLKKEEKVLLVLDNVWERLSLDEVGIPFGGDHEGCKLLLTARDLNALTSTGSEHNIPMGFLEDQEAWTLFSTAVGDCVEQSDELKNLAKDVAKACGGLPIAIVTIAKALKNKDVFEWRNALRELKKPSSSTLEGVAGETCSCIEFSYNQLKGEALRAIFLLCCVMISTYDASVRDLVIYVWGLGVFKSADRIEEVRDHVRTLVRRLTDASLLLDTPENESFSMHDVVRDVGRLIASRNQHVVKVMNDNIGRDWYDDGALKTSTRIFLNNAIELPQELRCPNLQLLYMEGTNALKIPDNFFARMPKIRVLHLSGFDLSSLPTSLCQLVDLRTLCMDACEVEDMALIGKLKKLESLSIGDYGIERLPEEICELTRLRFLDVECCSNLEVIPPNFMSRLTQLEELYLGNAYIQWEDQDGSNVLSKGLFSKTLERYHINIGGTAIERSPYSNLESRTLQLSCYKDVHHKMQCVKKVIYALDGGEGFPNLKQLFVGDSSFFHTVADRSELNSCDPFPCLETLILHKLNNLETICNGQLGAKNLCHLVSTEVSNCAKLKNIFSFSTSRALPLQEIEVCDCANMTEIFAIGREEDIIQLKELCSLTLMSLPQLTSFCSINNNEVIAEDKRDAPTPFFNVTVAFPKLERIKISRMDNLEMICDNQLTNDSFSSLKSVKISECWSLKNLFPASVAKGLLLLEQLTISECGQLVEIVAREGVDIEAVTGFDFPRLTSLRLFDLPQLRHFYPGIANWPALKELRISNCQGIGSLASEESNKEGRSNIPALFFVKKVAFPKLERIEISCMDNLEMICDNQLANDSFSSLKSMEISDCRSLKNLFPASAAKGLSLLEQLTISQCGQLMEIVAKEVADIEAVTGFDFPRLTSLRLFGLPQLRHFYLGTTNWPALNELTMFDCQRIVSLASEESNKEGQSDVLALFFVKKVAFPKLERIEISRMDNLEMIYGNQLANDSFRSLKSVEISECRSLKNLFPTSVTKGLLLLEQLTISKCGQLVEIVAKEVADIEAVTEFDFPRLTSLRLFGLPQLRHFYHGTTNCQALNELRMTDCHEIGLLTSEESNKEGQFDIPALFFVKKVAFPKLERIEISRMDNLEMKYDNQLANDSFRSLKSMEISECRSLKNLFPTSIAKGLLLLEQLTISKCGQLVEIVANEVADIEAVTEFDFPRLTSLRLFGLPQLKHFYRGTTNCPALNELRMTDCHEIGSLTSEESNKEGQFDIPALFFVKKVAFPKLKWIEISRMDNLEMIFDNQLAKDSFGSLKFVTISECRSLKNLFPASVAMGLSLLEQLTISKCGQLVEIFAKEGADIETVTGFDFPRLTSLRLFGLPQLRHFYPGTANWLALNKLRISDCQGIGSLTSEETNKEGQSEIPALFFVKKGYCLNLEELYLGRENFRLISQAHFSEHLIPKLKFLEVSDDKSAVFLPDILWRFLNLEKIQLKDSSYEEVFSLEEIEKHGEKLAQIKSLELERLERLKHIWKQHSKLDFILQKLEKLKVSDCGLADLLPSSASFQSLKTLRVKGCNNLTDILTSSTAKSLVQLTEMEISSCNELTKVVARDEGDITKYKIIFHKLNSLQLYDLSSLTNFCIEEYDFEFPSLESLEVISCSKMESFSPGCLSTPKLNTVEGRDDIWEGDINTLIQQMYEKRSRYMVVCNMPAKYNSIASQIE